MPDHHGARVAHGTTPAGELTCGYVLVDVTSLRDKMRGIEYASNEMEIDPEVSKTRPEQLNIREDPFYFPEIDLNFDLAAFGIPSESSSGASTRSLPSTQSSLQISDEDGLDECERVGGEEEEAGLDIHSYSTPGGVSGFGSGPGTSFHAGNGSKSQEHYSLFEDEPLVLDNPVFDLGDDGFLHPAVSALLQDGDEAGMDPWAAHGGNVSIGGDNYPGVQLPDDQIHFDEDIIMFEDSEAAVQNAGAPVTPQRAGTEAQQSEHGTSLTESYQEQSETAEAPQQRVRQVKPLRPDQRTELTNRDLSNWNQNYLANMDEAYKAKQNQKSHREAKKKAEFWVMEQGIGNVATSFGADREPHPLAMFSGQSLWDLLKGVPIGVKRSRSGSETDEDGDDEEARRVRARTTSDEGVARGHDVGGDGFVFGDDDDVPMFPSDNFNPESEVGRQAPSSLPDRSSGMPWNVSASRHSSAQPLGSGLVARLSSSVGGLPGGMELGPPSALGRRGSRLTSASPLLGRGSGASRIGSPSLLTSNTEDEFADLDAQLGLGTDVEDFELYGPAADVDTQTAQQSSWIAMALENEANNFLSFVKTKINEQPRDQGEVGESTEMSNGITFEELLPPTQNSYIVGAQGLLHVLALVTRGLLEVTQGEPFGDIEISVANFT
ncbi:R8 protein [Knufia peltigerae]|uniref:R8 protein n=1 Tax=Knufia peltigerae TaxID=1002370 RepID=A0AA39CWL2_9EURO|nr:R8 protein [Knufia peltigerae]